MLSRAGRSCQFGRTSAPMIPNHALAELRHHYIDDRFKMTERADDP
jgi:hypothetical protein